MTETENELYEKLTTAFSSGDFLKEVEASREEYENRVSPIRTEAPDEGFIFTCFHSWYLLDRRIRKFIRTPVELVIDGKVIERTEDEKALLQSWAQSVHSLFHIKKVDENRIHLKDLFGKKTYICEAGSYKLMFQKDEILEARLFLKQENVKIGRLKKASIFGVLPGVCVHPRLSKKYIEKKCKILAKKTLHEREDFFFALQKSKLKSVRYSNVPAEAIYNDRPLF